MRPLPRCVEEQLALLLIAPVQPFEQQVNAQAAEEDRPSGRILQQRAVPVHEAERRQAGLLSPFCGKTTGYSGFLAFANTSSVSQLRLNRHIRRRRRAGLGLVTP